LKTIYRQKPEEMKLLAEEDKNSRKCKKESNKWINTALHRGHDDTHRATMGRLRAQGIYAANLF
jgi:hypothetical protein